MTVDQCSGVKAGAKRHDIVSSGSVSLAACEQAGDLTEDLEQVLNYLQRRISWSFID
ncbi:MAG: hypothetical protein IBX67_05190 [Dehalococcoidia bacterium]|nr:hypothetical protein [Dehalococcoidia bacterium]